MTVRLFLIFCFIFCVNSSFAQTSEDDYVNLINKKFKGIKEASVQSGRVDILNDEYAIEVDFARKWKEAVGQALWYGQQTLKKPGIVLIAESKTDQKYIIQLGATLQHFGLADKVRFWVYPYDFDVVLASPVQTGFWLTKSSKIRHNSSCNYFENTRGEFCKENEGTPCSRCGG